MPYAKFPEFSENKTFDYPRQLANIMSLSQAILNQMYKKENLMNNNNRNELFGKVSGKSLDKSCTSSFEFLDIFVEKDSRLNRHCDYSNDYRKGYTYGASYSYLIKRINTYDVYRVNFIMYTRRVVGAFMDEISKKKI